MTHSKILRSGSDGRKLWWCPGCKCVHAIPVEGPNAWSWNNDMDRPTFQPSVLVKGVRRDMSDEELAVYRSLPDGESRNDPRFALICHVFITDGMIQFLGDCSHELKNQTAPIPDWPYTPEQFHVS